MRTLTEQLAQYVAYHRDALRRHSNDHARVCRAVEPPCIHAHRVPIAISPAWALFAASTLYYLVPDVSLGLMMVVVSVLCVACGQWLAAQSMLTWLVSGIGLFVVGWAFQFVGHVAYEHRKPTFVDDVIGLLIGPLSVSAEMLFGLGWRPALREAIEARVGPTRINADRAATHH